MDAIVRYAWFAGILILLKLGTGFVTFLSLGRPYTWDLALATGLRFALILGAGAVLAWLLDRRGTRGLWFWAALAYAAYLAHSVITIFPVLSQDGFAARTLGLVGSGAVFDCALFAISAVIVLAFRRELVAKPQA